VGVLEGFFEGGWHGKKRGVLNVVRRNTLDMTSNMTSIFLKLGDTC
jgi:hypothetical protein